MARPDGQLAVEVVCLTADRPVQIELTVPLGTSVGEAVQLSGVAKSCPDLDLRHAKMGIYGRVVPQTTLVEDGDRVEVYRPLIADPKDARRRRVKPRQQRS